MATMEETEAVTYQTLADMFETRKRDDGTEFVALKDGVPEWALDFVREAHGTEWMPDDYRYETIREALWALADMDEGQDVDELATEFADDTNPYNYDLLKWLASNLRRASYADEAQDEGLCSPDMDLYQRIALGQYMERREIFQNVLNAFQNIG